MYAIRFLCPTHGETFKAPDKDDLLFFEKIESEYLSVAGQILAPDQPIRDGWKTRDLLTRHYKCWRDLFNPRQLLALDSLLREILAIEDKAVQECFLTLFSSCLEFNNTFCSYKGGNLRRPGAVRHIFSHHAFVYPYEALENNPWGARHLSGTFSHLYHARLLRAKSYALNSLERKVADRKVAKIISIPHERIRGKLSQSFSELISLDKNALLLCQSSEELPLPPSSVDAVITDPPYFDNVQYAELSDFFYVWLRLGLKDHYQEFSSFSVERKSEIVKNPNQGKTAQFYRDGLRRVFCECHRVLKKDGPLIFTFHHKSTEAWSTVLSAVLDSGFYISATYPIHSEMPLSVHIHNQKSPSYDAILVCRKQVSSPPIRNWKKLKQQIVKRALKTIDLLRRDNGKLSDVDTFVVVLGKCLETYSRHYPNIRWLNGPMSVDDALSEMEAIVRSLVTD
ncbi:MAG: DNA methyltransferase [Candidatus Methylomirabilales bacterium]